MEKETHGESLEEIPLQGGQLTHGMCAAYGWDDPIAIVDDFAADLQQALRNHQQAGRLGAVKVFQEEVNWMRLRAHELHLALR